MAHVPGHDRVTTRRQVIGSRVIDVQLIPFMRSRKVFFRARGLRPRTRYFPYFGRQGIDNFARNETSFQRFATRTDDNSNLFFNRTSHPDGSTNLTSDSSGELIGSFIVPNTATTKFRAGAQEFKLLDISGGVDADALSLARTNYNAQGVLETIQDTVRITRIIDRTVFIQPPDLSGGDGSGGGDGEGGDPLAQTFQVSSIDNPNGLFITKVRLYFNTKSSTVPVQVQLRPVTNGIPDNYPIPGAIVFKGASEVNIPADLNDLDTVRSSGTDFTFEEPVYLTPGREYAIVILAESTDYNVYVAKIYDFLLGTTEKRVNKQPTLGSFFMSQNGFTWTPDQERDLMFQIYRADFSTSATVQFKAADNIRELLPFPSILTDSGGTQCHVFMDGHGFAKNDKVFVQGVTDASVDGAFSFASSVNGSRTITKVDHTGFTFAADSSASASLLVGGNDTVVTRNMMYDTFIPNIQTLRPSAGTTIAASAKLVNGSSYAGTRNTGVTYTKAASYSSITLIERNRLTSPNVILNDSNEVVHSISGGSFDLKLDLATDDTKVSPVVDLQRTSVLTSENIIDKQDASVTTNFNVPITFVDETDQTQGSHAAKHVTIPVVIEEPAVGIKILFAANRPAAAGFRVYYKAGTADDTLDDLPYIELSEETSNPADENPEVFREYEYLAGGQVGNLDAFTKYQVKVVMTSTNSSKVPVIKDFRAIALVT
jgi:hypothetical protein